jgi:cullin-4
VTPHATTLLAKGFDDLMDNKRVTELRLLFELLSRVDKLKDMKSALGMYIEEKVRELLESASSRKTPAPPLPSSTSTSSSSAPAPSSSSSSSSSSFTSCVDGLLQLRDSIEVMYKEAFSSSETFKAAVKAHFEIAFTTKTNAAAELLAKFVDSKLRASKATDSDTEKTLDKVLVLFRCVRASGAGTKSRGGSMMTYKTTSPLTIMRVAGSATSDMRKPQILKRVRNDEA